MEMPMWPVLIIETRAYAIGKTIFEAQNQAAVLGSSMIDSLQQLNDLTGHVGQTPLAFSICTEGPHIEFGYNMLRRRIMCADTYYMNIFRACYGTL
jgi:hypothetical protein